MAAENMKWAIVYLKDEKKYRYVEIKSIERFNIEVFLADEVEGAKKSFVYLSSDKNRKKCQVLKIYSNYVPSTSFAEHVFNISFLSCHYV